jgi:hypothetical protein
VTAGRADAAEKILRDDLMHVQTHDGKMPSQLEADSPAASDTAQSLMDEIRSSNIF